MQESRNLKHKNALNTHVSFFMSSNGDFTAESIEAGLYKLGVIKPLAFLIARIIMTEANLAGCTSPSFFGGRKIERVNLYKMMHPFDTGLFKIGQGAFDNELFNKLMSYATQVDPVTGEKIISLQEIKAFKNKHNNDRWHDASIKEKLLGFASNKGEFYLLFKLLSDVNKNNVPYISLSRLKRFYTDGYELFHEIAEEVKNKEATQKLTSKFLCSKL